MASPSRTNLASRKCSATSSIFASSLSGKRFEFDPLCFRKRIPLLEGFQIIFTALDKAIKLIRESTGKPEAAEKLIKAFGLDDEQATAILDAQLYKIAQMEIQKILDELREKKKEARRIEEIPRSEEKLWGDHQRRIGSALATKYAEKRRRTRMATDEDVLDFDEEKYIVKENTNVVLTRDGWVKRVGRLASVEGTRVREGDEVIAVVPGNTLDHVAFFADDGTAYTMRMNEIPASSGYGEPIAKFFKLDDRVKVIAAESPTNGSSPPRPRRQRARIHQALGLLVVTSEWPDAARAVCSIPHGVHEIGPALRPSRRQRQSRAG